MEIRRFENARELVDSMNSISKRIWISADDPKNLTYGVVDENLEYVFEIRMSHMRDSGDLLNGEEIEAFRYSVDRWKLVKGVIITEHQKFLISHQYYNGISHYLRDVYEQELVFSNLRLNGELKELKEGDLPLYNIDPQKIPYCFGEDGEELIKVKFKERVFIPLFEISQLIMKRYNTIWDLKVDDFIGNNRILKEENNYYERIIKEIGKKVKIIIPIRTSTTVLPVIDCARSEMGFSFFIFIGIGVFK